MVGAARLELAKVTASKAAGYSIFHLAHAPTWFWIGPWVWTRTTPVSGHVLQTICWNPQLYPRILEEAAGPYPDAISQARTD